MNTKNQLFPCPCCGYLVFDLPTGSYDICPVCAWEDDLVQLRFPLMRGGANGASLLEAQQDYLAEEARETRKPEYVREEGWRPLDLARDNPAVPTEGIDYGKSYPKDSRLLYYWRPTYWRSPTSPESPE